MEIELAVNGIDAGYGDLAVLRDVTLAVFTGETVAIIGPNGAGKSTAIKAVIGIASVTGGKVSLGIDDITGITPEESIRKGMAYVPQSANVFVSLTVEENLEMGGYTLKGGVRAQIAAIYDIFPDLEKRRRHYAGGLSGGMRQILAMGKALMVAPRLLLLDEPTAGLSPKYRQFVFDLIKRINEGGTTVLMVEQNARQALSIADRAYVLVDGKNHREGTGAELLADESVVRGFLGG